MATGPSLRLRQDINLKGVIFSFRHPDMSELLSHFDNRVAALLPRAVADANNPSSFAILTAGLCCRHHVQILHTVTIPSPSFMGGKHRTYCCWVSGCEQRSCTRTTYPTVLTTTSATKGKHFHNFTPESTPISDSTLESTLRPRSTFEGFLDLGPLAGRQNLRHPGTGLCGHLRSVSTVAQNRSASLGMMPPDSMRDMTWE